MAKSGPQRFPGASTAYWYQSAYPGDSMESNVICWHTTEGRSLPSYSGGAEAPNFTMVPDFSAKVLKVYQHFDFDTSSRALVNLAGGVETNTLNVCQVEIVGTCDPTTHEKWRAAGYPHLYTPELPSWAVRDLAAFARWAYDNHGVPLTSSVTFKAYPSSYGTSNGVRMSASTWNDFTGHCGHQHVPENLHGDPGLLPMAAILTAAKGGTIPPEEDDMALSDADIEKVANKVVDKVFGADVIAAVAPPYNNDDWDDGNRTWSFKYAVHTPIVTGRETLARVKDIQAKVGTVDLSDADIAALASAVASNPALAEQIAEKVAVKLAERLAD